MARHIAERRTETKRDRAWITGVARCCAATLCGVLLLVASNAALADQFYFTRTKAPSTGTGDEGATLLVRWDDVAGTQTLLSTPHMSHATDGRVSVSAIATNGGTLYGLIVDDTSNAPLVPYNGCTTTCRSRLATINPANGTIAWVGAWLNGMNFDGAGFDPSGRLWAADSLTGDVFRLDPATGAIVGSPIETNATTVAGDIDFLSNGLGIFGYGGFTFVTFDPDTGAVGTGSFSATNSGFDGTLVPPYALSGIAFTNHLAARSGSAAATTCRINVGEGRGVDELGHVNDPWTTAAPIARKERNQLDPPNWATGYMNAGQGDMARVGGPAFPACIFDLGDAPNANYATTIASNGARHQIGGPILGSSLPDIDVNGAPNAAASGDDSANTDDEDGVVIPSLALGNTAQIQVRVAGASGATRLQGWIDWSRDGSFAQAEDRILSDAVVVNGTNTFDIAVPATAAVGTTYARLRIANTPGVGPAGMATTGEVEDYQVQVTQPDFGTCSSNMYLAQGTPTGLLAISSASNPFTYSPIGSASAFTYNGAAFNPADNYMYAMGLSGGNQTLFRIGSDGSVQALGPVSGGGIEGSSNPVSAGEIGPDGRYYVKRAENTNQMWRIDLSSRTATAIALSQSVWLGDLAWYNGMLYGHSHETGMLYAIDPANGATTTVGFTGIANVPFGAMFGATNGLYGTRNDGGFYRFDATSGAVTLISSSPASSNNDGAKCATAPMSFAADLSITKDDGSTTYTPGNNVAYTIVVSNAGPFGVQNAGVTDALPTGIASASWTCGGATNGATCGAASGSGAINTTANLPANSSVTYTLTLFVPSTFSGNLVNTATVTAPQGTTESNTANNTASDMDTQFPLPPANVANITCTSDASMLNTAYDGSGGRLTSGADTHWQVALTTTPVTGAPPAGLTYGAASVVTAPPANYMVSPYGNANWISHAANALHPTNVSYDIFYRYQLTLGPGTDPSTLAPRLDFYSDNAVYQVWVNGVAQGIRSNYGAADPYFYAGFTAGNPAAGTLTGPWTSGANEIVVHIKSGAPAQAFLAQVVLPQSICQPATVTLNKTTRLVAGGAFGFSLTNTTQANGTVTTTTAATPAPIDGDAATAGVQPFAVSAFGSDVVITENTLPAGWLLEDAVCTSNGTPVGSRSGSAYTIPGGQIDSSGEGFACTFTNTPTVNLRIDKTANPNTVRNGQPVTYTFRLDNDGPGPGDGAVFRDPPVAGMDCSAATLTCSATGGAACPSTLAVSALQGGGLALPTFPAGGSLQFAMTCTATTD